MKEVIQNVVKTKQKIGLTTEEIVAGMVHTICDQLGITYSDAIRIIRQAEMDKMVSDLVFTKLASDIKSAPSPSQPARLDKRSRRPIVSNLFSPK